MPDLSVRVDPLNWLLHGRLGVELEVAVVGPLTIELVPVFVTDTRPALLNLSGIEAEVSQHSNGLGSLAGAGIGAGLWLGGEPFRGYVLRAMLTNYGYSYDASSAGELVDRVSHVERRFVGYLGSQNRIGMFTIEGGLGLGYELNQQQRCELEPSVTSVQVNALATSGCDGALRIALDRGATATMDLNGWAHPIYVLARFSLGITFD